MVRIDYPLVELECFGVLALLVASVSLLSERIDDEELVSDLHLAGLLQVVSGMEHRVLQVVRVLVPLLSHDVAVVIHVEHTLVAEQTPHCRDVRQAEVWFERRQVRVLVLVWR